MDTKTDFVNNRNQLQAYQMVSRVNKENLFIFCLLLHIIQLRSILYIWSLRALLNNNHCHILACEQIYSISGNDYKSAWTGNIFMAYFPELTTGK
jgi:hypothetical protein